MSNTFINSFINSIRQQIEGGIDLAWEQSQNGDSAEAKEEGRAAYKYLSRMLVQLTGDTDDNH